MRIRDGPKGGREEKVEQTSPSWPVATPDPLSINSMPAAGVAKQPFYEWGWEGEREKGIRKGGERGSEREGRRVRLCFSACVWVGETRLRGACGGVGYVYVCERVTVRALCVCVVFMPLLRHCAVWNKGPILAVLPPEAARLAATADQLSEWGVTGAPQHFYFASFSEERLPDFCIFFFRISANILF